MRSRETSPAFIRRTILRGSQRMPKLNSAAASALAVAAIILAVNSARADNAKPWWLKLSAGASYDDNVNLSVLDLKSGKGDGIGNFGLSTGYKLVDSESSRLAISYDFSQSLHAKLTNFNIQSHEFGLSGTTSMGGATLGLSYSFYHLLLAGRSFLDMHVANPSVSGFVLPHIYVRGSYFYYRKSFYTVPGRDASNQQPDLTVFYFFNGAKSYVSMDSHYEIEKTSAPEYDYKGYAIGVKMQNPVDFGATTVDFQAGYTYLHRSYENITPSIGAKRFENRSTVRFATEIPLPDRFALAIDYRYMNRDSNLLITKYSENVIGSTLSYNF